ncbi:MAG: hypothetical protein ABSF12_17205 [Bryobacteraceae bacterium]|jgi:hypothetical protein
MKKLISLCALFALSTVMAMAADVTGTWKGEPGAKGPAPSFTFKQDGSALTGKSAGRNGDTDIANGKVDGDKIYFEVTREMGGNSMTFKYSGKVDGNTMKLSVETGRGPREMTLTRQ